MSSNKRGSTSSVSSSVESISLRLGISLTLGNTVVHQTSTITNSLDSSGNTDSSSSRGNSNASNTGSVSDNVGGVGNTDGGLGADLLRDVLAVVVSTRAMISWWHSWPLQGSKGSRVRPTGSQGVKG